MPLKPKYSIKKADIFDICIPLKEDLTMDKLNDSNLENVSGGLIFNAQNIAGSDPNNPWEVVDNKNGNVLARFNNEQAAKDYVTRTYGTYAYNTMEISWNDLVALRNNPIA